MSDKTIQPPRGERHTVLGIHLEPKDIAWVEGHGGMAWFSGEMERTLASLPDLEAVAEWKKLVNRKQEIETKARLIAYTALKAKLPPEQWRDIVDDRNELGDTFLALFRSYVRGFFRLIPELEAMVQEYEAVLARQEPVDAIVLSMLRDKQSGKWDSAGQALVQITKDRLKRTG